jgi:hypothetical protein
VREVEHLVAEPVVARPAPDQRHGARELDDLVRVEVRLAVRGRALAVPDRAVGDDLVRDDPGAVVEDVRDVADRAHVVLDRAELAERDARVRCVLTVDGEDPRVVGESGTDPADRRHVALVRPLRALVRPADVEVLGALREVGDVLLAPFDRVGELLVPREVELCPARQPLALGLLARQLGLRRARQRGELVLGLLDRLVRAGDRDPQPHRLAARDPHLVVQAPAGAGAERAVIALARHRRGRRVARALAAGAEGPVVPGADLAVDRRAVRADDRGVRVRRVLARERPGVAEPQRAARERAGVLLVVGRVGDDPAEAPGVLGHQLGVGVHVHVDQPRQLLRVGQRQPDEGAAPAVRREVGPAEPDAVDRRQRVADIALAARELGGRPDPGVVDPEVERVEQLERRRDDAAHLARGVPAVGIETPVLEPEHLRAGACRHLAPIL